MDDADRAESWSADRAGRWIRRGAALQRQLAPVTDVLFAAARLRTGESVLDAGCGTGTTTFAAAHAVGPTGRVVGLDVSAEMLAAAAATAAPPDAAPIEWLEADAVTWTPGGPQHDVVISRFGVMFFSDPPAGFANLAHATRDGGRLAVAVWQHRDASPVFAVPFQAAVSALRSRGVRSTAAGIDLDAFIVADGGAGPFSLHDPVAVTDLLHGAGWRDIAIEPHLLDLPFGGGVAPAEAAELALESGSTRVVLSGMDDDVVRGAEAAVRDALGRHVNGEGHVVLSGSINVVTASRG